MMTIREFIHPIQNLNKLSADGILLLKPDGIIDFVNTAFTQFSGYESADLKGKKINSILKIEKLEHLLNQVNKEMVFIQDLHLKLKNNKSKTSRVFISLLEFQGGVLGYMLIIQNKTPSDAIHKYQLQKNPILRAINTRKDLVWMVAEARSGHYLFCSDSFREIVGWDPGDFAEGGRAFSFSIFHPEDRERCFKSIADWSFKTNQDEPIYNHLPLVLHFRLKHKNCEWVKMVGEANVLEREPNNNVKLVL